MSVVKLGSGGTFAGEVTLPGSKSLSNRLLLLAALAEGETRLRGLLDSDDVAHLRRALLDLGVLLELESDTWVVRPRSLNQQADLFLGNAGTAFRPLTAVLAATPGDFILRGQPRMHERPIGPLVEALRLWGAEIEYLGEPGYPPLRIRGRKLSGGVTRVDGSISSQFVSALLMATPLLTAPSTIEVVGELVSQPYIDLTIRQMAQFGVAVQRVNPRCYQVGQGSYRSPGDLWVEGDATAASYFLAAGAIAGGPVRVFGAGRNSQQGEIRFAQVLGQMGAQVTWGDNWVELAAPAHGARLQGVSCDLNDIPDSAMTLAMVALFAQGPSEIRGVANWKVKECDRQQALHDELLKLGARVELLPDGLRVSPPQTWKSARIATYDDHRMAMCFSLAALGPVALEIENPECVAKTFPHYFEEFARLRQEAVAC